MNLSMLEYALRYHDSGQTCIPCSPVNKGSFVKWAEYQHRLATEDEIRSWFTRFPTAMLGGITGKLYGLTVIDTDPPDGEDNLLPFVPENCETPTAITPRGGKHRVFLYNPIVPNSKKIGGLLHVDGRNDGGYRILPPSCNSKGEAYKWLIPPDACSPLPVPGALIIHLNRFYNIECSQGTHNQTSQISRDSQLLTLDFSEGGRNDSLFTVANAIIKGGMSDVNALHLLIELNKLCKPPLQEKEIKQILKSVLDRSRRRERNIQAEVREYISVSDGEFSVSSVYEAVSSVSKEEKAAVRQALVTLCKSTTPIIERVGNKAGWYRPIQNDIQVMDFMSAPTEEFKVHLPLGIPEKCKLYPGNMVIVAGAKSSGKTAFLLDCVRLNMEIYQIDYLNSEMGETELRMRLESYPLALTDWKFRPIARSRDWWDLVKPENKITVIDYIEPPEDQIYLVGTYLRKIHEAMGGKGLCIIGLQKPPGRDQGRGGAFSMDKARLYIALDYDQEKRTNYVKIVDAKSWRGDENPRGMIREYKLIHGARYENMGRWHY